MLLVWGFSRALRYSLLDKDLRTEKCHLLGRFMSCCGGQAQVLAALWHIVLEKKISGHYAANSGVARKSVPPPTRTPLPSFFRNFLFWSLKKMLFTLKLEKPQMRDPAAAGVAVGFYASGCQQFTLPSHFKKYRCFILFFFFRQQQFHCFFWHLKKHYLYKVFIYNTQCFKLSCFWLFVLIICMFRTQQSLKVSRFLFFHVFCSSRTIYLFKANVNIGFERSLKAR